jgi:molybdopterin-guanine dinucleotide biosynthesis protein A
LTSWAGRFAGAVLAGGQSTRMGTDKAVLAVTGGPLAGVARDALVGAGAAEVLLVGGNRETLAPLEPLGFRFVDDRWPGQGPLGGLITALRACEHDVVVVLACDLPAVEAAAVTSVLRALGDADAAIPVVDGRLQTLVAAYRRRCVEGLEAAWAAGERSLRDAVRGLHTTLVALPDRRWTLNANRPADLDAGGQLSRPLDTEPDERRNHQ